MENITITIMTQKKISTQAQSSEIQPVVMLIVLILLQIVQ